MLILMRTVKLLDYFKGFYGGLFSPPYFYTMKKRIFLFLQATFLILFCATTHASIQKESSIHHSKKLIDESLKEEIDLESLDADLDAYIDPDTQLEKHILHNEKGVTFYLDHDYVNAIVEFSNAVNSKKDFAKGYNNLGLTYFKLNMLEQARDQFENAIKHNPDYFEAYNNLGSAHLDLGNYSKAIEALQKAKNFSKNDVEVIANLQQAIALKKHRSNLLLLLIASVFGIFLSFYLNSRYNRKK